MGGVSVEGGGGGGRKSVDSNVNMVPMIDLLISVIAFLLMTAVWVQTGVLQAAQPRNAPSPETSQPQEQQDQLKITVNQTELRVGLSAADNRVIADGPNQIEELRNELRRRHQQNPTNHEVWLQPEQAVIYNKIIEVMDVVYEIWGEGRSPGTHIRDTVTVRFL